MFKTRSISQLEKSLARTQAGLQEQNDLLSWLSGYVEESNEFKEFNTVYEERFHDHKPARSTIEVASLPLDCRVEIEAIAEFPTNQE